MKRLAPMFACVGLLASCAPSMTGPVAGRIVNTVTGQEGTVSFTRGTLKPRLDGPKATENATIVIGGQTYTGRTVIINSGVVTAPTWNVGFDWYSSNRTADRLGWYTSFGTPRSEVMVSRSGNLIARTATTPALTLACTLNVDVYEHGVGDCTGSDGAKYMLQF